jgi:peptidoglycan-associated lipoprotein
MMMRSAGFRTAALMSCFLALAACSKKNTPDLDAGLGGNGSGLDAGNGGASPGSQSDFETNVGDRVYFLVDQTTLTPEGRDILSRQAQWLQQYPAAVSYTHLRAHETM